MSDFDPADHTVDEVVAYVAKHPNTREAVLDAERAGKGRVTLVDQLEADDEPVAAKSAPPEVSTFVTTTDTEDYNGRALLNIATTATDYMGRLVLTGDLDYMGRATVA